MCLKMVVLPERENLNVQRCLNIGHNKFDYLCFVNELMFDKNNSQDRVKMAVEEVNFVINKIILDNIFKYVVYDKSDSLLNLLNNRTFTKDLYINHFYSSQVLELTDVSQEDKTEAENILNKKLCKYIDDIYVANTDFLNENILNMFLFMDNHLKYLNILYYKFELINRQKPVLLYSEKEQYPCTI